MPFNIEKCQVLQVEKKKKYDYVKRGVKLKNVQCGKDLGANTALNLKLSQQWNDAYSFQGVGSYTTVEAGSAFPG